MSYNPRHAIVRAVRSLPKWARAGILATAASGSIAGLAVAALPSGASISPTTVFTTNGVAGYYSTPNATRTANGDSVTGVRTQFYLRTSAEYSNPGWAHIGVALCRYKSGFGASAVEFAQWNPSTHLFDIYAGHTPTSTNTACLDTDSGVKYKYLIDSVPAGHTVFLAITVDKHHVVHFTDFDQTTGQQGTSYQFGWWTFGFNRGAVGTQADNNHLTTNATHKLAIFHKSSLRDGPGWASINRAGLTRMIITKVVDTANGTPGSALINPVNLMSDGFKLLMGQYSNF